MRRQHRKAAVLLAGCLSGVLLTAGIRTPARAAEVLVAPPGASVQGAVTVTDLQSVLTRVEPQTVIRLSPGTYDLHARPYSEPTCGNCQQAATRVEATVGLRVSGQGIRIEGAGDGEAVIRTHAGYGILFDNCTDCSLGGVTVTGGQRDPDPHATDAAVVAKQSRVTVENCLIRDNIGDSTLVAKNVVGIIGIAGRQGADLTVRNNRIIRNSWDGIALYRGAHAVIESNVIDGVDLARGKVVGGGRGVGIGVTWDSQAAIRGNLVRRYWKGIGGFVNAQITVEENVVEHIATWGLSLWDAGSGRPAGFFLRNVVYDTGACGASIIRQNEGPPFPGRLVQNVFIMTGQDPRYDSGEPYCFQLPIARHAVPAAFSIAGNILHENRIADGKPDPDDVGERAFLYRMKAIWERLQPWTALRESDFWKDFGGGKAG